MLFTPPSPTPQEQRASPPPPPPSWGFLDLDLFGTDTFFLNVLRPRAFWCRRGFLHVLRLMLLSRTELRVIRYFEESSVCLFAPAPPPKTLPRVSCLQQHRRSSDPGILLRSRGRFAPVLSDSSPSSTPLEYRGAFFCFRMGCFPCFFLLQLRRALQYRVHLL